MKTSPHRTNAFSLLSVVSLLALAGCSERGIEEQQVDKGVESLPSQEASQEADQEAGQDVDGSAPAQAGPQDLPSPDSEPDTSTSDGDTAPARTTPWAVPDGWVLDPTPRQMRLATYLVEDESGRAEVAITRFPGDVGGVLANINRWRGQMGLAPVSPDGLEGVIARFETEGYSGYEARIESPRGVMLAVGVFDQAANQTWFVRVNMPDAPSADRVWPGVSAMARSLTDGAGG